MIRRNDVRSPLHNVGSIFHRARNPHRPQDKPSPLNCQPLSHSAGHKTAYNDDGGCYNRRACDNNNDRQDHSGKNMDGESQCWFLIEQECSDRPPARATAAFDSFRRKPNPGFSILRSTRNFSTPAFAGLTASNRRISRKVPGNLPGLPKDSDHVHTTVDLSGNQIKYINPWSILRRLRLLSR